MQPASEPFLLQQASRGDAHKIASLYLASRADALPYLRRVHSDDDVREWIANMVLTREDAWVTRLGSAIVGFMALVAEEIDQLYVLPGHYRHGIGRSLLDLAKARRPAGLFLYTFQRNSRARAFYESQGFQMAGMSDGSRNEEREPDIRYEWTPNRNPA